MSVSWIHAINRPQKSAPKSAKHVPEETFPVARPPAQARDAGQDDNESCGPHLDLKVSERELSTPSQREGSQPKEPAGLS